MTRLAAAKPDATLVKANDTARSVLLEQAPAADIGEHLGHEVEIEAEKVVTHFFECTRPGYLGWRWAVTIARAPRQKDVTVNEIVLLPGPDAIVAPTWLPYSQRLQPGDLSPGDLLPVEDEDPRLVPTYLVGNDADGNAQVKAVAADLGLGRVRTLSVEGRDLAAQRWYDGDSGPEAPIAKSAPAACTTCGFLVRIAGPLSEMFGVCANGNANDDGRIVSFDHGCGAHSEVKLSRKNQPVPSAEHAFDTLSIDDFETF